MDNFETFIEQTAMDFDDQFVEAYDILNVKYNALPRTEQYDKAGKAKIEMTKLIIDIADSVSKEDLPRIGRDSHMGGVPYRHRGYGVDEVRRFENNFRMKEAVMYLQFGV